MPDNQQTEPATVVETKQETPKVTTAETDNLSKLTEMVAKLSEKIDNMEKGRFSPEKIRDIAARNVIDKEINKEENTLMLRKHKEKLEEGKTAMELRNIKWEQLANRYRGGFVPPAEMDFAIRSPGSDGEHKQALALALFWELGPSKGIPHEKMRNLHLLKAAHDFERMNGYQGLRNLINLIE